MPLCAQALVCAGRGHTHPAMHASLWVQALEDVGVLNDTYIFFAPDNGFKVGASLELKGAQGMPAA